MHITQWQMIGLKMRHTFCSRKLVIRLWLQLEQGACPECLGHHDKSLAAPSPPESTTEKNTLHL